MKVRNGSNKKYKTLEVTVPKKIREECGIKKGDIIIAYPIAEGIFLFCRQDCETQAKDFLEGQRLFRRVDKLKSTD